MIKLNFTPGESVELPTPDVQQQQVLDWIRQGEGNALISAVAGSGKTTTLLMCAGIVDKPGKFMAFGHRIVEELELKLYGTSMTASTFHSIGYKALPQACRDDTKKAGKPDTFKYQRILDRLIPGAMRDRWWRQTGGTSAALHLSQVVNAARIRLVEPDADLVAEIAVGMEDEALQDDGAVLATKAIEEGAKHLDKRPDYTDMIWLPLYHEMKIPRSQWVFIDEAQDMNPIQRVFSRRTIVEGGRVVAVGDRAQAIFEFAGASADSLDRVKARLKAVELPLTTCYRCPAAVVELAQRFVPEIQARPDAPEGIVGCVSEQDVASGKLLRPKDLVLSRTTRPLVKLCLGLLSRGIPAIVVGRDMGKSLVATAKALAVRAGGWNTTRLVVVAEDYKHAQHERITKRNGGYQDPAAFESIDDRVNATCCLIEHCGATSARAFAHYVDEIFTKDASDKVISLSTVHRAKGLESPRVFLLEPHKMPLVFLDRSSGQYNHASSQEVNLQYVAVTRAKEAFYFVGEPWPDPR